GSLGLDLATAVDVTLIDSKLTKVPTGVAGPVIYKGNPCGALLLRRSSSGLKGLFVLPGVRDADFTVEICIVIMALFPPMIVPAGSTIAQLVPANQMTEAASAVSCSQRGNAGFGSTGPVALLSLPMGECPIMPIILEQETQQHRLIALMDTGADITII
ncbi:POK9 protein, partial [Campylorhamphus procurvoides]|nr:POK9 protein [Campylorhamphus procurvoides]